MAVRLAVGPKEVVVDALSRLDAAFLESEDADEHVSMAIASVAIFDDAPPSQQELLTAFAGRLHLVPRYRQRVWRFPFDVAAPLWVDDPQFDLTYHLRRTSLPEPGGDAELSALVSRVMTQRLDRDRPLWETWVVEGLNGGRWALISKVHHCVVDGIAGTELYHLLLSTTPETDDTLTSAAPVPTEPTPTWRTAAGVVSSVASRPVRHVRTVGSQLRHPSRLVGDVIAAGQGLLAFRHVVAPATSSTLLGRIGRQRRWAAISVPLDDVKRVRQTYGVTVNDVALAMVTAGLRSLLLARGEAPRPHTVRSLVPASVRPPGAEGELANQVSCMFADLPVHLADPRERLVAVHALLEEAKRSHEADAGAALVALGDYVPFPLVATLTRTALRLPQHNIVTVTTNVPGPQQPLYLLGRQMVQLLPFVPIADRVRIGVAILSYCDQLSFGVTGDYDAVDDIDVLLTATRDALAPLLPSAAGNASMAR
jgi:WS/DGAT/MGAT family acyltransferase